MTNFNENVLVFVSKGYAFAKEVLSLLENGYTQRLDSADLEWFRKNAFQIRMQVELLGEVKKDMYKNYDNLMNGKSLNSKSIGFKYLALENCSHVLSKFAHLVYSNPDSPLTEKLCRNSLMTGIVFFRTARNGHRVVKIYWRDYVSAIKGIQEIYKKQIIELKRADKTK